MSGRTVISSSVDLLNAGSILGEAICDVNHNSITPAAKSTSRGVEIRGTYQSASIVGPGILPLTARAG